MPDIVVRYTKPMVGETLPYAVSVSGDLVAKQLPRDHPDWINWGIDVIEANGEILPFVLADESEPTDYEKEGSCQNST